MAATGHGGNQGALPLEESKRQTPPGWKPGIPRYSVKKYLTRLCLWWRTKSVEDPAVASLLVMHRLSRGALKPALRFSVERGRQTFVGEDALSLAAVEADPNNGADAVPSGMQFSFCAGCRQNTAFTIKIMSQ